MCVDYLSVCLKNAVRYVEEKTFKHPILGERHIYDDILEQATVPYLY